jgi:hypothetical protein
MKQGLSSPKSYYQSINCKKVSSFEFHAIESKKITQKNFNSCLVEPKSAFLKVDIRNMTGHENYTMLCS